MTETNGRVLLAREKHLDNNDHAFGEYLRNLGWIGDFEKDGNRNKYLLPHGKMIALVSYDNSKCTFKVWVAQEHQIPPVSLTIGQGIEFGEKIAEALSLKEYRPVGDKISEPLYRTDFGTKTKLGLGRIILRLLNETKGK